MDMKKLLSLVSEEVKETKQLNESIVECGEMPPPPSTPPVSMSINMNASGVDQIKELLGLMNGGSSASSSQPAPMPMPTVGMNAPLAISAPEPEPASEPEGDSLSAMLKKAGLPARPEKEEEAFDNEPDEEIGDMDDAVPHGDDLHREKTMYKRAQPGDNPMATESLRDMLEAQYKAFKEGFDFSAKTGDKKKTQHGVMTKTATGVKHERTYGKQDDDADDDKPKAKSKKK